MGGEDGLRACSLQVLADAVSVAVVGLWLPGRRPSHSSSSKQPLAEVAANDQPLQGAIPSHHEDDGFSSLPCCWPHRDAHVMCKATCLGYLLIAHLGIPLLVTYPLSKLDNSHLHAQGVHHPRGLRPHLFLRGLQVECSTALGERLPAADTTLVAWQE